MSARSELQQNVIAELEAMGMTAEGNLGKVQGRSGYSRDVYFEDVRVGFAGRLRIFSPEFVTVNFGNAESERWNSTEDAVSEIAATYEQVRDGAAPEVAVSTAGHPERPAAPFVAAAKGRPSTEVIEAVRIALLGRAAKASGEDRAEFARMAVALGATAEELLTLVI